MERRERAWTALLFSGESCNCRRSIAFNCLCAFLVTDRVIDRMWVCLPYVIKKRIALLISEATTTTSWAYANRRGAQHNMWRNRKEKKQKNAENCLELRRITFLLPFTWKRKMVEPIDRFARTHRMDGEQRYSPVCESFVWRPCAACRTSTEQQRNHRQHI